ncbi:MAG TPA: DUF5916 domain-containing protein, partial [Terriglobia bacterium]|nr:DUF5916 domain-containing protein [Terriglobia bacterium]
MTQHSHYQDDRSGARQPERFDPERAARLDDPARFEYLPPQEVAQMLDAPANARVLDFGTGTGTYAIELARLRPDVEVIALDEQPAMLARLRGKPAAGSLSNLKPLLAEQSAGLTGQIDRVLALNVLHELGDEALKSLRALLKSHGSALLIDSISLSKLRVLRFFGFLGLCYMLLLLPGAAGSDVASASRMVSVPRIEKPMTLEELASRHVAGAMPIRDFIQYYPHEGQPTTHETTAYLAYDHQYLYVGFVCVDDVTKLRAHVTQRDAISSDDSVTLILDTYDDQRHAYVFSVNPYGVQADGLAQDLIYSGTSLQGEDLTYDTVWYSAARLTNHGYVALIRIPFNSLRFPRTQPQSWGIILMRYVPRDIELSTWPAVSRTINGWLIQEGKARGLEGISPGKGLQFIPYSYFSSDRVLNPDTGLFRRDRFMQRVGLDAKYLLASNLTLDATLNPDFSQVESDQPQITVNQRFEVLFPEKRPFFMENSNFFETPISLAFTRRIADPQFGVKLTGHQGPYTIGGLVADDRSPGEIVLPQDPAFGRRALFDILRISRNIGEASSVGFMWTDREFFNSYNRVFGMDGRYKFSTTSGLNFQVLKSFSQQAGEKPTQGGALYLSTDHHTPGWDSVITYDQYSPNFQVDSGYVPRVDIRRIKWNEGFPIRPVASRWIVDYGPFTVGDVVWDSNNLRQDINVDSGACILFTHYTHACGGYDRFQSRFEGIDFALHSYNVSIVSQPTKWFSTTFSDAWGEYINYTPATGLDPFKGRGENVSFQFTVLPTRRLVVRNTILENRLVTRQVGKNIFNNNIFRSEWNYQFTRRLSLRTIGQYSNVLPSPELSSLNIEKTLSGDFLFAYLVQPGTALYVGYNNLLQNYDRNFLAA